MKRILPIFVLIVFLSTPVQAGFIIPTDIQNPPRFKASSSSAQKLSKEECDEKLMNGSPRCNRIEFCSERGMAMLEVFMKNRQRMMTLISKAAHNEIVFVRIVDANDKSKDPMTLIREFRATEVDSSSGQDIYTAGACGKAKIYSYFVMTRHALALMNRSDYVAERRARNAKTANKYIKRSDKDTKTIVEGKWFPKIRDYDARILFLQRMLYLCCGLDTCAHHGWPQNEDEWTQQEFMKLYSGNKAVNRRVSADNRRLVRISTGEISSVPGHKVTVDNKKGTTPKSYTAPVDPQTRDSSQGSQSDLGGGGDTMFGHEATFKLQPTQPKQTKTKKPKH